jgi:hypothetical protein
MGKPPLPPRCPSASRHSLGLFRSVSTLVFDVLDSSWTSAETLLKSAETLLTERRDAFELTRAETFGRSGVRAWSVYVYRCIRADAHVFRIVADRPLSPALTMVRASAYVRARAHVRVRVRACACVRCVRARDRIPCPSATVFGQSTDASRDRHLVLTAGSPRLGPSAESCRDPLPTGGPDLL